MNDRIPFSVFDFIHPGEYFHYKAAVFSLPGAEIRSVNQHLFPAVQLFRIDGAVCDILLEFCRITVQHLDSDRHDGFRNTKLAADQVHPFHVLNRFHRTPVFIAPGLGVRQFFIVQEQPVIIGSESMHGADGVNDIFAARPD